MQATGKGPGLKIGKDHRLVATIERCIRAGESPDMITHRISSEAEADSVTLCTSIIYRYLYANLFLHVSWQDLILGPYKKRQSRRYNRPSYHKTQASVVQALDRIERELRAKGFRDTFRTITVDNGSEFLGTPELERSCLQRNKQRTQVYYAHLYSAWERGSNENLNRIIRRFIPKGSDISRFTQQEINRLEQWLNIYPRKILIYLTPAEAWARSN